MSVKDETGRAVVSPITAVLDGFTMPPDAQSWALVRGIRADDLGHLPMSPAGQLLRNHRSILKGVEGSAEALQSVLNANVKSMDLVALVSHLCMNGLLLTPLAGMRRDWKCHLIVPHLPEWLAGVQALAPGKRFKPKDRRLLQNLWLCTVEGRVAHPDRPMVERFLGTLVTSSGGCLRGLPAGMVEGVRGAGAAFGLTALRKYAPTREAVEQVQEDPTLSEWQRLNTEFLEARHLGAVSRYELAFGHFCKYLLENRNVAKLGNFFDRTIERPSLSAWLQNRIGSASHYSAMLTGLYSFFEWIIAGSDELSAPDDDGGARIARTNISIPIRQSEVDSVQSKRRSEVEESAETVHFALPAEYLDDISHILFDNEMEWPKKRRGDWIDWVSPSDGQKRRIYCPVLPYLIGLLVNLPLRQVQARRLDSGEGDSETFDPTSKCFVPNRGLHAGYWEGIGVARPQRGALRKIEDFDSGRTICGIFVNSNKTADRRTLFDERSGYVIQWQNEFVIDLIEKMRSWQETYNPVDGPTKYTDVRPGVFEKMAANVAGRRSDCFYLFRYPAGNSSRFAASPPSGQQLRMFWYEVLAEVERRRKLVDPSAPNLISQWLGNSPQASPYTLHGLRHGGLTRLAMAGVHPWILQNIVAGHAAWIMTLYYIKPNSAHISDTLTEAYVAAMRDGQDELKSFLATRTLAEAHRVAVGSKDAFASLAALKESGLGDITGHLASQDHGICPNGRTRCSEGCLITDLTERKPRELREAYGPVPPTPGGGPDCTRCRFFLTGTPFMEGLRVKTNAVSVAASESASRFHQLRQDVDDMEAHQARALKGGNSVDVRDRHSLQLCRQEMKAEAEILADYCLSIDSHAKKWQQVRALARKQKEAGEEAVPALLFDAVPEFHWEMQSRLEAIDELCVAARWFPSLRTAELGRERREAVMRLLIRNRKTPALALMTEEEGDVAASAIVASLYRRFGKGATRKLFDEQETFESLGLVADVEEVMETAIGRPLTLQIAELSRNREERQAKPKSIESRRRLQPFSGSVS